MSYFFFQAEDGIRGKWRNTLRQPAVDRLDRALKNGGRAVIAYGSGPGRAWSFPEFFANAETAGFVVEHKFSSWELDPYTDRSEFLVAVLRRPKPYGLGQ